MEQEKSPNDGRVQYEYDIEETHCYPNKWKIVAIGCKPSNVDFFKTIEQAKFCIVARYSSKLRKIIRL